MTLKEQLKKCRITVKIGTLNGGGWIFIGHPKTFLKNADKYQAEINKRIELWSVRDKWYSEYQGRALPLLERQVAEIYRADRAVDKALCLLIDGNETGGHWMTSDAIEEPFFFKGFIKRTQYGEI